MTFCKVCLRAICEIQAMKLQIVSLCAFKIKKYNLTKK